MLQSDVLALLGVGVGASAEEKDHIRTETHALPELTSAEDEQDHAPACLDLNEITKWLTTKTAAFYETPRAEKAHRTFTTQYVAEDCVHDTYYGGIATREEQFANIRQKRNTRPNWYNVVHDVTPHVHVEGDVGFAQMYVYISIVGYREGVDMPHFGVLNWVLKNGRWWIVRHEAFRAPPTKRPGFLCACGELVGFGKRGCSLISSWRFPRVLTGKISGTGLLVKGMFTRGTRLMRTKSFRGLPILETAVFRYTNHSIHSRLSSIYKPGFSESVGRYRLSGTLDGLLDYLWGV